MVKACLFAWGRSRYIISVEVDWNALEKMAFEYKNRGRTSHLTTTPEQDFLAYISSYSFSRLRCTLRHRRADGVLDNMCTLPGNTDRHWSSLSLNIDIHANTGVRCISHSLQRKMSIDP